DLSRSAEQEVAGAGRAVQRRYLGFVLQLHAGELAAAGFAHQIQQTVRGEVVGETFGADVGDAVALGVVAADLWRPGEVEAQAVRRAEAGAFAQQDHRHTRLESLADLVSNGHTALFDEADRAQRPAFAAAVFDDRQRHRQSVALHGQRREAVGDHQGEVAGWLIELIQPRGAGFVQAPAQVWALQVELSVGGGAVQAQAIELMLLQRVQQRFAVQRQVHGVARLGVGELEVQLRAGGQAGTGATEGDARRGELAQVLPGVGRGGGMGGHGYLVFRYHGQTRGKDLRSFSTLRLRWMCRRRVENRAAFSTGMQVASAEWFMSVAAVPGGTARAARGPGAGDGRPGAGCPSSPATPRIAARP